MRNTFLHILLSLWIVLTGCAKVELTVSDSKGILQHVSSLKGQKAVLLNVWATWCIPCVEEFPMIVGLDKSFDEVDVIFISADFTEQSNAVQSFLNDQGVDGISFMKDEKDEAFINGLHPEWSGLLPYTILYGKQSGKIVDFWEGKEPETKFREAILLAINQ
tara:strand:- start:10202 stop:10687 length:486 start_codon:yes stop_codon:yes gene_type:complete